MNPSLTQDVFLQLLEEAVTHKLHHWRRTWWPMMALSGHDKGGGVTDLLSRSEAMLVVVVDSCLM